MSFNTNFVDELSKDANLFLNLLIGASDNLFIDILKHFITTKYNKKEDQKIANISIEIFNNLYKTSITCSVYTEQIVQFSPEYLNKIEIFIYTPDRETVIFIGNVDKGKITFDIDSEKISKIKNEIKIFVEKEITVDDNEL